MGNFSLAQSLSKTSSAAERGLCSGDKQLAVETGLRTGRAIQGRGKTPRQLPKLPQRSHSPGKQSRRAWWGKEVLWSAVTGREEHRLTENHADKWFERLSPYAWWDASSSRGPWPQGAPSSVKEARLSGVGSKINTSKQGSRKGWGKRIKKKTDRGWRKRRKRATNESEGERGRGEGKDPIPSTSQVLIKKETRARILEHPLWDASWLLTT